ncbi:MAG: DNA-binding protein [Candidatus Aenigmatarchaeota archaeon]
MDVQPEQLETMKREMLRKILDKAALERMGRVRIANPMLASQLEVYLIQLFQAGQLREALTDEKLKKILDTLTEKKKTSIRRK